MRLLSAFLAAALAASAASAQIPGGTYTLGPSPGSDFETFEEAFLELKARGVAGAVVIEVEQATYDGPVTLSSIPGASATNTVSFVGLESGAALPVVRGTPTLAEPYLVAVERSPHVSFDNLRFEVADRFQRRGTLLLIRSDDVTVRNCEFRSIAASAVVAGTDAVAVDVYGDRVTVADNVVDEGDVGVRFNAKSSGDRAFGGAILGNALDRNRSRGVWVRGQGAPSGNAVIVRDNSVVQNAVDVAGWVGIHLEDHVEGAVIVRNRVIPRTGTGTRIQDVVIEGSSWVSVANNMVAASFFGAGPGMGIDVANADRVRVLNNTVHIEDDDGAALAVDNQSSSVRIENNVLVHDGEGYLLDITSAGVIESLDYQVLQSTGAPTKMRVRFRGLEYVDLAAYQAASRAAANTIVWPVEFRGTSDLHLAGRSDGDGRLIGKPQGSAAPFDYDGEPRDPVRPYRGADEAATPLSPPPPLMSGTYSIGRGADYVTFNDALADLDARGVDGPTTFEIAGGPYQEQLDMGPVPGSSAANPVTFVGMGPTPEIANDALGSLFDYVLRLTRVENVAFVNLAFRSQDALWADVVRMDGGRDVTFDGCAFYAESPDRGTLLSLSRRTLSTSGQSTGNASGVRVLDSTFGGGDVGLSVSPVNAPASGFEIVGNRFGAFNAGARFGIEVGTNASGVLLRGNRVEAPASESGFVGLSLVGSTGFATSVEADIVVERNEVVAGEGTGIRWVGFNTALSPPGTALRVVNNAVRMNGDGPTVGLRIETPDDVLFAHNTVSVASTDPASAAATVAYSTTNGKSLDLRNNVLDANGGRALDLDVPASSAYVYDGNALATRGPALATYTVGTLFDGDCADIECVRAANRNTQDQSSIEKAVSFASAAEGDLRLADEVGADPEMAALPLPEVAADLDGDPRSATRPYRGADEGLPSLDPYTIAGGEGWRTLALPKEGLELGGSGPGGRRFRAGFLQGLYTAGYVGADRDQRNARGRANVLVYDEPTGQLVPPARSESVRLGEGFWVYAFADDDSFTDGVQGTFPKTLDASGGAPWEGTFQFDLSFTTRSPAPGLNLLGNPYDEAIAWGATGWSRDGVEDMVWVFDPAYNGGDFRTWTSRGAGDLYSGVIGAGQGFYVQATRAGARMSVRPEARIGRRGSVRSLTTPGDPTNGTAAPGKAAAPGLAFRLTGAHAADTREAATFLSFYDGASIGSDVPRLAGRSGADAFRLYALAPPAQRTAGETLAVLSLPSDLGAPVEVPLHAEALAGGVPAPADAILSWSGDLPHGWSATLVDRGSGRTFDLTEPGAAGLSISARDALSHSPADRPSQKSPDPLAPTAVPAPRALSVGAPESVRFSILLVPGDASPEERTATAFGAIGPNPARNVASLDVTLAEAGEVTLELYDVIGRRVASVRTDLAAGVHRLAVPARGLAPGSYVVRVSAGAGSVARRLTVVR